MLNLYVAYTTVIMLLGTFPVALKFRFFKYFWPVRVYIYTSAHTLARSLHDVYCANNNRFAVVVCFRLAFYASGMRIFLKILYHYDDVTIQ